MSECVRADLSEPVSLPAALRGCRRTDQRCSVLPDRATPWRAEVDTATQLGRPS